MSEALVAEGPGMGHCHASLLASRSVLRVRGADARKYLQGLITNDMGKAQGGEAIHAGLLSPQGKILFDFFVVPAGDGFLVDVAQDKAEELLKRLAFYRLRAQVEIAEEPSLVVAVAWGGTPRQPEGAIVYADPRLPELGFRLLAPKGTSAADFGCEPAPEEDYHAFRIRHGVDFAKGCYVGQEVVSRMEHRGTARKRIVPVEGEAPLPSSGTDIEVDGVPIGSLGSVSGASSLALIRLDRAEEALASGKKLTAGGIKIALRRPAFLPFPLPISVALP